MHCMRRRSAISTELENGCYDGAVHCGVRTTYTCKARVPPGITRLCVRPDANVVGVRASVALSGSEEREREREREMKLMILMSCSSTYATELQ